MATRKEVQEQVNVVQAWLDGKAIEVEFVHGPRGWWVEDEPTFNFKAYRYRVQPAPKASLWAVTFRGDVRGCFGSQEKARAYAANVPGSRVVKLEEVSE